MTNDATTPEYLAGFDCGKNGPNISNCHFHNFATPEMTKRWEHGKSDAEWKLGEPEKSQ
jgi:hypothetical protein